MKILAALACLLFVTVGCGQETSNSEPAPTVSQSSAPAPANASQPEPATAAATPAPPQSASTGEGIEAGEAVDTGESPATRADTLMAAAVMDTPQEPAMRWQQGVNYKLLVPAQPTSAPPDKVEVVYIFWYACGHCYALDPYLHAWNDKKAPYIEFTRLPVMWGPAHRAHARLFYTLAALGKVDELHSAVFKEIQVNKNVLVSNDPIETEQMQVEFAKRHGISEDEFRKAYNSFAVETSLQRADQLTKRYQVGGVPFIVINGKYTTDVGSAGGQNQLVALINDLAAREHAKQ
ncbi:MAG TPA: thiol:disulfide interchange protein DsbA/DsbL [Steroidobacteraceae bacterium]|nr:thiol:disulfide interchange protein DsbA/DsbL [Steroidobacteraceae bacterium]